ncbi:MAG: methionyl-tRNA formyltransferase [Bacilli bacterium]|nr:methionyl-tRNA formyltransferase [Bacilli bacterium]MDD3895518.1 methionyl-tRNA formyltransferase [Bacilli bacterium]MDD4407572.1 methionyl-tRNA formyltransferase [Bacilli bacterium]
MKKLKVIFMGTPLFSVPILKSLIENTNVILVVTSPDAYVGRKKILTPCPVKEVALEANIPVYSPLNIKESYQEIIDKQPDIIITCAYGQIIPKELIELPHLGCINIHASLLPKYRGGAPIHHAILNDEKETGITIMYMDEGMDSGDIISKQSIRIEETDNLETLSNKLSLLGKEMIIKELPLIINHKNNREKQNLNEVTYAPIIKREHERIDFNKTAKQVFDLVRALSPEPLAYFIIDNIDYKVVECNIVESKGKIGTITNVDKDSFTIMASDKGIRITKIKPKGKNIMTVRDFFNGYNKNNFINKEVI